MWDLRIVKIIKNKKTKIVIKDVYINSDDTIGAIADRNFSLDSNSLQELREKIDFIQTHVFGRQIVVRDLDKNITL